MHKTIKKVQMLGVPVRNLQALIQRWLMVFMPTQIVEVPNFNFEWEDFKYNLRTWHVILAVVTLTLVAIISWTIISKEIPILELSMLKAFVKGIELLVNTILGRNTNLGQLLYAVAPLLLVFFKDSIVSLYGIAASDSNLLKSLPSYAMNEEKSFRFGSETWSAIDRFRAVLVFGLMHFSMVIVPVGVALTLSIGGAVFMIVYLSEYKKTESVEKALIQSATLHTAYNFCAIVLLILVLLVSIISLIILLING